MARLGDICTIQSGGTPSRHNKAYWDDGTIPWVKISDIKDKYLDATEERITKLGLENSSAKIFPAGTILYTIFATLGEVCILNIEAATNQAISGIQLESEQVDKNYLYHYLSSLKSIVNNIGRGVAQNNINMTILRNFEIPLPPLEEQRKIAAVLDNVSDLIAKRRTQLDKLDEMVKSRFVEMFGDTVLNPYDWNKDFLGTVCNVRDGTHDSPQYYQTGYPLVTSKNVTAGKIDLSNCSLISEADYNKINERSKVDKGDIIMPMIGTVGKPVIVEIEPNFAIKNVALIKFRQASKVLNIYIRTLLQSDYFDDAVISKIRGGTQKFISLGDIRNLEVLVPPIELQNQFADFVKQTDKSKLAIQKNLEKLEILRKSLMQKYFD